MTRKPVDFRKLQEDLSEINAWLAAQGISGRTRVRNYEENIAEMLQLSERFDAASFELVIGAMIATAGFKPRLGSTPDVEFDGRRALIECKRVMSVNKVEERILRAVKQLKANAKRTNDFGLVAISITRTINSGGVIWGVPLGSEMRPFLNSKLLDVIQRLDPFLQTISHPNVVGVVFYIASPIFVSGIGFSPVNMGMVYPLPGATNIAELKSLAATLRA